MRFLSLASMASFCLLSAAAQSSSIATPGLGLAYDSRSNAIRPIQGIAGAAILGAAFDTGSSLATAVISPQQDLALAVSIDDSQLRVIQFQTDGPRMLPINGAMAAPMRVVFSPSGQAAALIGNKIQILTGLTGSPVVQDLARPALAADPAAVAPSDDGQLLLLASGTEDGDPVWLVTGNGAVPLPLPGSIAAASFRRNSHDAVAVTRTGGVYVIRNAGPNAEIRQLYAGDGQTSDPVAVRFSPDGTRAYTANTRGTLSTIDLENGSATAIDCQCAPTGLEPLSSPSLFRLTEISNRPVMLFDASAPESRIWFVPPDPSPANSERSGQ